MTLVLPGSTVGVLGSGQLGRMFAIAARRLGYRVHVLSPDTDTPAGQVADLEINAPYHDLDAVAKFAQAVSVVTFEFENVPSETTRVCEQYAPVRPAGNVLHITQNRIREKTFLRQAGLPVTPFARVTSLEDLQCAARELGLPAVLKTAAWGYDGKGQTKLPIDADLPAVWRMFEQESIYESFIDFERELSVIAVRGAGGECVTYGPLENQHANHILDVTLFPAEISPQVKKEAEDIARGVVEALEVVGVLCVELFLAPGGKLMINELAPRPHNSGHLTIDAHITCQFEQQLRAVCGLPLGSSAPLRPAAMANLLGDLWSDRSPDWNAALAFPEVKLHLYGKQAARPGRKMGHLTALADSPAEARVRVLAARGALTAT